MKRYLGWRGVFRGGIGSVGYLNWPRWVQALLTRQLHHMALQHSVFRQKHWRFGQWIPGNSLHFFCWSLISSASKLFLGASSVACKISRVAIIIYTVANNKSKQLLKQVTTPVFALSTRNAWHYDPQNVDSAFPETRVTSMLIYNKLVAVKD